MQTVAAMYPSQYRKYLKLWKEHNVAALHESGFQWLVKHAKRVGGSYKESNGIIYRVYFPVYVEASIPQEIVDVLEKAECSLDPESSYCIDKHGRRVSINKAYQSNAKKQGVAADDVKGALKTYAEQLGSSGAMLLCVSRHPYDVAGMSTGRSWQSCHTLGGFTPKEKRAKKEYEDALAEYNARYDVVDRAYNNAKQVYKAAHKRLNALQKDYADLENSALEAFIDATCLELFDLVFEDTGMLECTDDLKKIALDLLKEVMESDLARMHVRLAILDFAVPDKRYHEYMNAEVFGSTKYYDFYKNLSRDMRNRVIDNTHEDNAEDNAEDNIVRMNRLLEELGFDGENPDVEPERGFPIDFDVLESNSALVPEFYEKRAATVISADKLEKAAKLVPEIIAAYKHQQEVDDTYTESRVKLYAIRCIFDDLPQKPQNGRFYRRVEKDVLTGSVIAYVIKPKLNLLTSLERAKRVDVRMVTELNTRLDKSNKDPLFEPLGRVILRTANGKYLRPGVMYGFSYNEKIRVQFEKMAKMLSVVLNKATRRDSGGAEPLYHYYDPDVDETYEEGDLVGAATTRPRPWEPLYHYDS